MHIKKCFEIWFELLQSFPGRQFKSGPFCFVKHFISQAISLSFPLCSYDTDDTVLPGAPYFIMCLYWSICIIFRITLESHEESFFKKPFIYRYLQRGAIHEQLALSLYQMLTSTNLGDKLLPLKIGWMNWDWNILNPNSLIRDVFWIIQINL